MKRATSTALALILATGAAPALAQATYVFSDIDTDGNLELSAAEFARVGQEEFGRWDRNADQRIDETEFYVAGYDAWDVDRDGILTEQEYDAGWVAWYGDVDPVTYTVLDADADGIVTQDEFGAGLGDSGIYDTWDTAGDGYLDVDEFSTGLYSTYDTDNDLVVAQAEYDAFGGVGGADNEVQANIVNLAEWRYDDLYASGISAEEFIDEMEVFGLTGDEIGEVEDLIIGSDGRVLSVVAEVGGLWDIGDTHVSIPWDQIELMAGGEGIIVPVTEETVDDYGFFDNELITAATAATEITAEIDDAATGPRAWRISELIGDYARLRDNDSYRNYGYINDVILRDGEIAAVVVNSDAGYGTRGRYAYPYYGYDAGYGWEPGSQYYDMPYAEDEIGDMEAFDYDRF